MGWKEYKQTLGVVHDFAEFQCPEYWVELRRADSLPYGETKGAGLTPEGLEELRRDPAKAEAARGKFEADLVDCILNWHIPDPRLPEDSLAAASLPLPRDTPDSLSVLPLEFILQMIVWLQEDSKIAEKVSKLKGISFGQP